jgi:uncharacterized repeat protein (TIGR03803 family)
VLADFSISSGSPNGGVILDGGGNVYGVTDGGGTYQGGVVYELMPQTGGGWTQKWLHQFGQGTSMISKSQEETEVSFHLEGPCFEA